jgi:hypothetical protein
MSNSVSQLDSSLFGNQVFWLINTNIRPAKVLDIQLNYFRSHVTGDHPVDSMKYKAVVQNVQVAPTFKKKLFGISHRLTLLFSLNSTATSEAPFMFLPTSIMTNKQLSYSAELKGLSITASYGILGRKFGAPTLTKGASTNTLALGARGRFMDNHLQPFITLNLAGTKLSTTTPPTVFGRKNYIRAGCQYRFSSKTSGQMVITNNRFRFGAPGSPVKNEFFVELELKHRL